MKETVAEFTRRTGLACDPPEFVTKQARALTANEALPTLFRFPGACGLLDHFLGTDERLGPVPEGELWAADAPVNVEARGAAHFGTIALLQPFRFRFALHSPGIYVGLNSPMPPDERVWVPPSKVGAAIPWDSIATAGDAAAYLGDTSRERRQVLDALEVYREELEAVARAQMPDPQVRWCDRPEEERLRLMSERGVSGRWTAQGATRTA